jgi:hypothetical protein
MTFKRRVWLRSPVRIGWDSVLRRAFGIVLMLTASSLGGVKAGEQVSPWVILDVGLVRITPTRPGANQPWSRVVGKPKRDLCGVVGLAAEALTTPLRLALIDHARRAWV